MITKCLLDAKEALETLDLKRIQSIYAEDFVFEDVSGGERITERASLNDYYEKLFSFPNVSFSDFRIYDGGTFGALEWTWSGINRKTEEDYHIHGASVIELRSGKIARESIYYDPRPAI